MKKYFNKNILMVILFLTTFTIFFLQMDVTKADGGTYYVSSVNGNDKNNGSADSPWKTIQKAAGSVKAGDTVVVRGGTYKEKVTMKTSGTSNDYITFKNYEGETPIIDGSGQSASDDDSTNALILINNQSYIKVVGFSVTNYVVSNQSVPAGIRVTGASKNVEIRNCKVYGIKTTYSGSNQDRNAHAIAIYGSNSNSAIDGLVIDNCEVYNCVLGQSESIALNGNVTNFKVTNNKVHDNDNIGIDFIGYEGTASSNDYVRSGICSGNQVWNISSAKNKTYTDLCADGIYVDGGADIVIENNKVWASDIGIETASEHKNKATDKVTVRNNLVYNCGLYGISMGGSGDTNGKATNIKIYNNTAYNNSVNMNIQKYCQYSSNVIKNNIFYQGTAFEGTKTSIVISNNVTSNPKFVNPGVDFHLQADSAAINAGVNDSDIGSVDLDGNTRIQGGTVDCGCYEKQ
ncbi:Right handed beta helix region [Anaerocolumna jejuensis DSM 15929]|uniref:Right handed beta helix region n=1 Tax=Anaerocolumna jejuensis DSM 15929 TaxID=1121322 RepID=A0A1M6Q5S4_9FIRM|nr:right-handed parallel beta-helix repeat-containing protein [Anaerocolumna jejuensis]SHK15500.1 Right handed beta helix region [Anaerocolumna jejuensis DSM 15929]